MQKIDALLDHMPDWAMGIIFAGLIYTILGIIFYFLQIIFPDSLWTEILIIVLGLIGWHVDGDLSSIVAWSTPYLILGGLIGLVENKMIRILILLLAFAALAAFSLFVLISYAYWGAG